MSDITNQPLRSFLLNLRSLLTAVLQAAIIHSIELARSKWKDVLNQIRLRHCVNSNEKGQAQGGALVAMLFNLYFLVWESWRNPELDRPRAHLGCGVETCQGAPSCVPVHSSEKGGEAGWASGAGHNPGLLRLRRKAGFGSLLERVPLTPSPTLHNNIRSSSNSNDELLTFPEYLLGTKPLS